MSYEKQVTMKKKVISTLINAYVPNLMMMQGQDTFGGESNAYTSTTMTW